MRWGNIRSEATNDGISLQIELLNPPPRSTPLSQSSNQSMYDSLNESEIFPITIRVALPIGTYAELIRSPKATNSVPMKIDGYEWFRGIRCARIKIVPVKNYQPGVINTNIKFVSDSKHQVQQTMQRDPHFGRVKEALVANYVSSKTEPSVPLAWSDTTGLWISFDKKYLKLAISEDGIYRLKYEDLNGAIDNIDAVDPRTFKVYNKGKEIPIYVFGEEDGKFSSGDYIEFPGLKNYGDKDYRSIPSATSEYPQYMNRYTDTSYYWLTWDGALGTRMKTNMGTTGDIDTLSWYMEKIHMEEDHWLSFIGNDDVANQNPQWQLNDMWGWEFLGAGGVINVAVNIDNLNASGSFGKTYVRFANSGASTANLQKMWLTVNSSDTLASMHVGRFQHALLQADVPVSVLQNGSNTINLYSQSLSSDWNSMLFDWTDLEYPRWLVARGDSLIFSFAQIPASASYKVMVQGFKSSQIVAYKVTSTLERINQWTIQTGSSNSIIFSDTVAPQDKYIICAAENIKTPRIVEHKTMTNLRNSTLAADYILLTASQFIPVANSYVSFIQQACSLRTIVVNVADVFDEFGYGYPTPESIREFLKATTRWQSPMPSYLFIVGDATYDYKYVIAGSDKSKWPENAVPSYGYPVSDPMLTALDDSSILPQLYVGRLPAESVQEFQNYFDHYQSYVSQKNDDWNKRYIFFAGGDPSTPGQIQAFQQVNQQIVNQYIYPGPIGGDAYQFYKTTNPTSDYGPYSMAYVQNAISQGAVIIEYIGHSGTQTWDNGIADPLQLQNTRNRYPLICDFGCSTAKFAESNIRCFGELFVTSGDVGTIGYIGNSALGFVSIAETLPTLFFKIICQDSIKELGVAHYRAKLELMSSVYGGPSSPLNQVVMLTNTLLGDPTVHLAIPSSPNLRIQSADLTLSPSIPTDNSSAATLIIPYMNSGTVQADTFRTVVTHTYLQQSSDTILTRICPRYKDTMNIAFSTLGKAGEHAFTVKLNVNKQMIESDTTDNDAKISFAVLSSDFQMLKPYYQLEQPPGDIILLNPAQAMYPNSSPVVFEVDTNVAFSNSFHTQISMGVVTTKIIGVPLLPEKTYYWRAKLNTSSSNWSQGFFHTGAATGTLWHPSKDIWQNYETMTNVHYTTTSDIQISKRTVEVKITSASYYEGSYGLAEFDGQEVLPNSFFWGHAVIVLDTINASPKDVRQFKISESTGTQADSLASYLEQLPSGMKVIEFVQTDGAQGLTSRIKQAIRNIGSVYIDSLGYRDSWIIFGQKGAPIGTATEIWHKGIPNVTNPSILDTTILKTIFNGTLQSNDIGPVGSWGNIQISKIIKPSTSIDLSISGISPDGSIDSLIINNRDSVISLSSISAQRYPKLRMTAQLNADSTGTSPILKDWFVSLVPPAELAINRQTISISSDSVLEGTPIQFIVNVFNKGNIKADSVKVVSSVLQSAGVVNSDTSILTSLKPDSFSTVVFNYPTNNRRGINTFSAIIDPNQRIAELFKGNNVYAFDFFVRTDTVRPSFDITFDGRHIFNGDYVLAQPLIRINIHDNSPLPITDPSSIMLALDNRRISLGSNPDSVFSPQTGSEKAFVIFKPSLAQGAHVLAVQVKDASGNYADSTAQQINFLVETESKLLNVFNYPNPFTSETYFTFNLVGTQLADEVIIFIYTVAGRLVQKLTIPRSGLLPGFNRIYWDGRDHDGDELANGVYFYKAVLRFNGKTEEVIQKLAKVR